MYENLELLMFQHKISKHDVAKTIGVTYNTLLGKLSGKFSFKLDEAFKIQSEYFPDKNINYIFEKKESQKSA